MDIDFSAIARQRQSPTEKVTTNESVQNTLRDMNTTENCSVWHPKKIFRARIPLRGILAHPCLLQPRSPDPCLLQYSRRLFIQPTIHSPMSLYNTSNSLPISPPSVDARDTIQCKLRVYTSVGACMDIDFLATARQRQSPTYLLLTYLLTWIIVELIQSNT
jgi:hypothetical protein